ncbi:bifunctional protein-disulfide isomerase/oxidoreductase DsbC [Haemophilus sputorum]|uniref:bifunctional protein-disulfide isomerase/oxidoreductase DsbC n=1 Tax=Haemophilus sputorum TaxID=1078480 RepID=UPI0021065EF4|nr:bifunctional protein-disulfide isomerase/oxidoreductase DsbC [Haemophilus sputorum]MCQ1857846.1 bifunctional protein-disulfide isomerase/oxidoreductase DsbC [Haemophilus sputorum]
MKKTKIALLALSLFAGSAMADDASLKSSLEKMGATNVRLSESPLPGFRLATSNEGIVHISENGQYVVQGNFNVLELKNGKATDITHKTQMASLNALSNEMIIYPAKQEKHVVTVFMDITCHYCHILFENVKAYNEEGITLRFLAFPRAGVNTQTAKQMEAIWQAKDRMKALEDAEAGNLPKELKTPNLVKKHYELGIQFGVTGTPYMVTDKGEVIGGYVPAKELAKMLSE